MAATARDSGLLTGRALLGTAATFAGATGLLASTGFVVQQTMFAMIGLPSPPLGTSDYLRVAGLFLFDIVVLVVLLQAVKLVLPLLLVLFAVAVWSGAQSRLKSRAMFMRRYGDTLHSLGRFYDRRLNGAIGLTICLIGFIVFTFVYHYPVFEQRNVFAPARFCGDPEQSPIQFWPVTSLWGRIDCGSLELREVVLNWDRNHAAQGLYRRGVTWLALLAVYTMTHRYSPFRRARPPLSAARRFLWWVVAGFLLLSLFFLPGGYAVLFSQKLAPLVSVSFRGADAASGAAGKLRNEAAWQAEIRARDWYLLFQNDKEVWLFRRPETRIIPKDTIGELKTQRRGWLLGR